MSHSVDESELLFLYIIIDWTATNEYVPINNIVKRYFITKYGGGDRRCKCLEWSTIIVGSSEDRQFNNTIINMIMFVIIQHSYKIIAGIPDVFYRCIIILYYWFIISDFFIFKLVIHRVVHSYVEMITNDKFRLKIHEGWKMLITNTPYDDPLLRSVSPKFSDIFRLVYCFFFKLFFLV